jgi:hypothetical protein
MRNVVMGGGVRKVGAAIVSVILEKSLFDFRFLRRYSQFGRHEMVGGKLHEIWSFE